MKGYLEHSVRTLHAMTSAGGNGRDVAIPAEILRQALGFVFLTQVKAGLLWSGTLGVGVIVRRLGGERWSAPSSVGTAGVGFGLQARAPPLTHPTPARRRGQASPRRLLAADA